jgi:hypothetical protein
VWDSMWLSVGRWMVVDLSRWFFTFLEASTLSQWWRIGHSDGGYALGECVIAIKLDVKVVKAVKRRLNCIISRDHCLLILVLSN